MLRFEKITEKDLEFVNFVRNMYAAEFLHDNRTFSLDDTIEWYKKTNPNYLIIYYYDMRIGYVRLSNYSEHNKNIMVGADIAPEHKGQGLGKLTYQKLIPYLFEKYSLHKISLEVLSTNLVAINLYKKVGFEYEGTKREEVYKNGKWIDSIIMSILRTKYQF
jgi:RimJ/RimL family protein N-acetyltransferase